MRLTSTSPEMTRRIGARLARLLRAADLVALSGPLGAGKTCFVQGLAEGLGIRAVVSSPSFVLAKHYPGAPGLLHVDAYRLETPEEFWELGLQEQAEASVMAVEWAGNVAEALSGERIEVALEDGGDDTRLMEFAARGERPGQVLGQLADEETGA
jgi:tRNA threonylcarbamoyladenosine biosynthesis protein TsaE